MGGACSLDNAADAHEALEEASCHQSARCSQMLCDVQTRNGNVVCAAVGNAILGYSTATGRKLSSLDGHPSPVTCLAARGSRLYSGAVDKTVRRWDFDAGKTVLTMTGHSGAIWALLIYGEDLFSASEDKTIIRWNAEKGTKLTQFSGHDAPVRVLVEVNGMLVSGSEDCKVLRWNMQTSTIVGEMAHNAMVTCLLVAEDGALFSGSADGSIKKWDAGTGELRAALEGHAEWVTCLMCAEGFLLSGGRDRTVRRWCLQTGSLLSTYELGTISFKRRSGFLVGMGDGTVCISKSVDGEKFSKVDHEDGRVSLKTKAGKYLSATRDGQVSAASETVGEDEKFDLLDNGDSSLSIRSVHQKYLAASQEGAVTARRSAAGDAEEEEKFSHFFIESHYSGVTCLLSVDGALLSGAADRSVKLWDLSSGMLLASLEGRTGVTCLLAAGGALYAGAARGAPLRLPRPKPLAHRLRPPLSATPAAAVVPTSACESKERAADSAKPSSAPDAPK